MSMSPRTLLKTCIAAAALMLAGSTWAIEVGGVKLDDAVKVAGKELKLNGAGLRGRARLR